MAIGFRSFRWCWIAAVLVAVVITALGPIRSTAASRRVLIVPFSIHADKDLTFLQKGVTAMLSSRLTDMGKVGVIDQAEAAGIVAGLPSPLTREDAVLAGRAAGADYVAFGSLTVFGNNVSTDARFAETATSALLVTFNETGQSQGDVIGHINKFAADVNTRVFGRTADAADAVVPQSPAATPANPDQQNPEKRIYSGNSGMQIQATNPDIDVTGARLWRSRRFNLNIKGLALGDVDADGVVETVFAGENEVSLYRYNKGQFLKISETAAEQDFVCVAVDVGDINGNGRDEIFLIGRTEKYWPKTVVLEWNGSQLETVQVITGWFFRIQRDAKSGRKVLYGQKGYTRDSNIGQVDSVSPVVHGPLYRMAWIEGDYRPQETYAIPDKGSVFGFAFGDVTGDGIEDWVTYTAGDLLQLSTTGGREEWTSGESYGGNNNFLISAGDYRRRDEGWMTKRDTDPLPLNVFYLPQRILLVDFDKNGHNEVLVLQNYDITQGLMQRQRSFREGHFECLAWDNVGLRTLWRTRKFSGYISDYNLGDFDNDGQDEVVFVVVKKIGDPMTGEAKSYLVSWDPYQTEGKEKAE
jgi:hypothetical protein